MGRLAVPLHALVLTLIDLASGLAGFVLYKALRPASQLGVQIPTAIVLTVAGFALWIALTRRTALGWGRLGRGERLGAYFLALLWAALLFVPLHYLREGYLSAASNVFALWIFQLPANGLALAAAAGIAPGSDREKRSGL